MVWLLELLIEGIREILAQFIIDMMDLITGMFTELLSCDLSLFGELFSVVGDLYKNVIVPMGIAILLLICVWQLFKSMFGRMAEYSEDPVELVLRSCICLFFIMAARPIVNYILDFAGTPYQWVAGTDIKVESFSGYVSALEGASGVLGIDSLSIMILKLVMQFVVAWNYFKILSVIAERYVLLGVFSYTSPLAFSTGGAKATNSILASWGKMFGGQIVLIILNAWCLKMFLSGFGNLIASGYGFTKFFVASLCLVGFCKITLKLDTYMSSLGINLGRPSTGGGAIGLMMAAGRLFSHAGGGAGSGASDVETPAGGSDKEGTSGSGDTSQPMAEGMGGPIPMGTESMKTGAGTMDSHQEGSGSDKDGAVTEINGDSGQMPESMEADNVLDELGSMPEVGQDAGSMEPDSQPEYGDEMTGLKEQPGVLAGAGDMDGAEPAGMEHGGEAGIINDLGGIDGVPMEEESLPVAMEPEMDMEGTVAGESGLDANLTTEGNSSGSSFTSYNDTEGIGGSAGGSRAGHAGGDGLAEVGGTTMAEPESPVPHSLQPEGFDNEIPSAVPGREIGGHPESMGGEIRPFEGGDNQTAPVSDSHMESGSYMKSASQLREGPMQNSNVSGNIGNTVMDQDIGLPEDGYQPVQDLGRGIPEVPRSREELKQKRS